MKKEYENVVDGIKDKLNQKQIEREKKEKERVEDLNGIFIYLLRDTELLSMIKANMWLGEEKSGIIVAKSNGETSSIIIKFDGTILVESLDDKISGIYGLQLSEEESKSYSLLKIQEIPRRSKSSRKPIDSTIGLDFRNVLKNEEFKQLDWGKIINAISKQVTVDGK